jgi:hypothetical protein
MKQQPIPRIQTILPAVEVISPDEALEIATEACIYAYPLVIAELTRRSSVAGPNGTPVNQFSHRRAFPDSNFTQVVRPNADTLYSTMWFDVSREPLVISVPDSKGRYYLLPMLDMWTDVFASLGSRTTGDKSELIVLAGTGWKGSIPQSAILIQSPTALGWIIGRTQTNGSEDYLNVHRFQEGFTVTPLSRLDRPYAVTHTPVEPSWDLKTPPVELIEKLSAQAYFGLFADLMKLNPPHANDYPMIHRLARIGIVPGRFFSFPSASAEIKHALENAMSDSFLQIKNLSRAGTIVNGWRVRFSGIGSYGTDYRGRAAIAYSGLGANLVEDAIYPAAFADADGKPFSGDKSYTLHFDREQLPPVHAFWSLTMYDERQSFTSNSINRYAIGDRDRLAFNSDGSLDIYIQRGSPGQGKESNWLPTPAKGTFTMNLRLYWPKAEALNGTWAPPPVKRIY